MGRPAKEPTPEHVMAARRLLGEVVYPSRAARRLRRTYGISLATATQAVDLATAAARREMRSGVIPGPVRAQLLRVLDRAAAVADAIEAQADNGGREAGGGI